MMDELAADRTQRLANVATIGIAIAAILIVSLSMYDRFFEPAANDPAREDREISGWDTLVGSARMVGAPHASVVILVFADYECPFCRRAKGVLDEILRRYPQTVAIGYKHLPLSDIHPNAYAAARVAECAADQGSFSEMNDLLYRAVTLADLNVDFLVQAAGISDAEGFSECIRRTGPVYRIERDIADAEALEIRGTPTYIVEGLLLGGVPDVEALSELIEARIKGRS